jgi:hypothetical protein
MVSSAATVGRIELEDGGAAGAHRIRRMGREVAQSLCEALLPGIVEMSLVAEEDDLVLGERRLDRRDGGGRQFAVQSETVDPRADAAGERSDVEVERIRMGSLGCSHVSLPVSVVFLHRGPVLILAGVDLIVYKNY